MKPLTYPCCDSPATGWYLMDCGLRNGVRILEVVCSHCGEAAERAVAWALRRRAA